MFRLVLPLILLPLLLRPVRSEEPGDFSAEDLAKRVKPAVVTIAPDGREGAPMGIGTGFLISPDGLVATNMHVIGEGRRLRVDLADGTAAEVLEVVAWNRDADLAILRIAGKDLPALPLAEESPPQGAPVVVMGNPRGLRHSVVEGVLSATREIEGREMLQLAIPIEQGNSGGPVLDRAGRVLGVVTLKSVVTDNLGFAVPVAALKKLKDSPSPVAMKNWLTIGALNPKRWQPGGCDWTQRAGVIRARGIATGFGGRALCVYQPEPPEMPYEVSVEVRQSDESGAAGLIFCADGKHVHYGFYPTSGGQRLTRFEGPDVYSWTILEQLRSPAYRPGDWNHLRVRVEPDRILCWLNGEQIASNADSAFRTGRAGLCTFRGTEADFRNFRIARDLAPAAAAPAGLRDVIREIGQGAAVTPEKIQQLAADAEASRIAAADEAAQLEKRAALLRQTALQAHEAGTLARLKSLMARDQDREIPLAECALLMARMENPDIDPAVTLDELDRMAAELNAALTDADKSSPATLLARLNQWMFQENGFHGSQEEMTNPANSRLNEVIDDREGIPLTLAIVHMELARRIGLNVEGVPFPGYFMTRLGQGRDKTDDKDKDAAEGAAGEGAQKEETYIDVFDRGRILSRDDARQRVYDMFGAAPPEETHRAATHRGMILRMAANLTAWAVERDEPERVLRWLNVTLELDPGDSTSRLQRVLLHARHGRKAEARADVAELLRQQPAGMDLEKLRDLQADLGGE